jgi:hypothetical protein
MTLSRTSILIIAAILGAVFLVERGDRIRIEAPQADLAEVAACPANESVPFSPECMAFIQGADLEIPKRIAVPSQGTFPLSPELPGEN